MYKQKNKNVQFYKEHYSNHNEYKRNLEPMYKTINSLINFNCKSFLDYGCGRSNLSELFYERKKYKVYKYDPAIEEYNQLKDDLKVDLIANCDVMEHIPEDEIDDMLNHISSISKNVFFNIYLKKAQTILPNGENAHCTVKPKKWWINKINKYFKTTNIIKTTYKNSISIITWNISNRDRLILLINNTIIVVEFIIWKLRKVILNR